MPRERLLQKETQRASNRCHAKFPRWLVFLSKKMIAGDFARHDADRAWRGAIIETGRDAEQLGRLGKTVGKEALKFVPLVGTAICVRGRFDIVVANRIAIVERG